MNDAKSSQERADGPLGPLFGLGSIVATPGAIAEFTSAFMVSCLRRHVTGDWGDVDREDAASNLASVLDGTRIMSVYRCRGRVLWIITEADRSSTTYLLPEEY